MFAFSSLWYAHFALQALQRLRAERMIVELEVAEPAAPPALPPALPSVAPPALPPASRT